MRLEIRRPSPSFVLASIALFVALAGIAYALDRNSVRSRHIVNGQVKTNDLATDAVSQEKIDDAAVGPTELRDGGVTPEKLGAIPAVRAQSPSESLNNDQVLNPGAEPLQFDEELYDTEDMHTGGTYDTEQSKFFAPRDGIYDVSSGLIFSESSTTDGVDRQIFLLRNGTTYLASEQVAPKSTGVTILNVATTAKLAEGDYVQAMITHDAGSNLVTPQSQFGGFGDGRHFFAMAWVGPDTEPPQ